MWLQYNLMVLYLRKTLNLFLGYFVGYGFLLRNSSRRVVMGLVVDHELDLTEVRIKELYHLVDVFVITESNITAGIQ